MLSACRTLTCRTLITPRFIHISPAHHAGSKWRLAQGEPANGNEYGQLTDIPDWSYADGRPAPLGFKEKNRRIKQEETGKRIVQLIGEMKQARHKHTDKLKTEQRQADEKEGTLLRSRSSQT